MTYWQKKTRKFAAIKGLDPDAEWLLERKAARDQFLRASLASGGDTEPPFAFLLSPVSRAVSGSDLLVALDAIGHKGRFNMSEADRDRLAHGETAGALCDADFINAILDKADEQNPFAGMDKSMRLSSAIPSLAAPSPRAKPFAEPAGLADKLAGLFPGDKVVIGVIDDGFAIAHPRLRLADKLTRVASFWDQEAAFAKKKSTVPFGRELLKAKFNGVDGLDDVLGAYSGPVAEIYGDSRLEKFYPKTRNLMPRNSSHGTAVLDLAAGARTGTGADRPVVAVKLPRASVLDTSGAHLEFFLLQGVHHILSRAAMLFGNPDAETSKSRVIIVASYGFFGGPLDGSSQFERALDHVIAAHHGRVQIILPSGNGRMDRAHAVRPNCGPIGHKRKVDWRSPAGDRTPSVMEIWTDPVVGSPQVATVSMTLATPYGLSSASIGFTDVDVDKKLVLTDVSGRILAQAVCDHPPLHPGRRRLMVWLAPTAALPPAVSPPTLSPSGIWKVRFENEAATATDLSVWIRRDDSLPGFPRLGRQSSIERDPPQEGPMPLNQKQWERWDVYGSASVVGTISSIASGQLTVVTSGFGAADFRPAQSAAGGPVALMATGAPSKPLDPSKRRVGPDCLAPSRVTSLRGIKAANFFGGARIAHSGTSLASPLVGHWLAGLYLSGVNALDGRQRTRDIAQGSDALMPSAWKPDAARGSDRFLTKAMVNRTFRYDAIP